jgi:hypothetical protein
MRKVAVFIIALGALAACNRTERMNEAMDSWKGRSETDLIRHFGAPTSSADSGGSRFLTWDDRRVGVTMASYSGTKFCKRTFELQGGVVQHSSYEGNNCRAKNAGARRSA